MSYVALGSRVNAPRAEHAARRAITETRMITVPHDDDREPKAAARIRKAAVGRDHRPLLSNGMRGGSPSDDSRATGVDALDLDRLASQVYGRIKQRLAVDRERRGFVR
jgi:hypothetical protein